MAIDHRYFNHDDNHHQMDLHGSMMALDIITIPIIPIITIITIKTIITIITIIMIMTR